MACWLRTGRSCRGGLSYACLEDLDQAQAFITRALEADPERLSWRQTAAALQGLLARP